MAVQGIEGLGGRIAVRIGRRDPVAVRVVGIARGLVLAADSLHEAVHLVVDPGPGTAQGPAGILHVFADAIAEGIQGIVNAIAEIVLQGNRPMRGVVGVAQGRAIRQRRAEEIARCIVVEGGGLPIDRARDEPPAGVIGELGQGAVGIADRERPAMGVAGGDLGRVAQGVGDGDQIARRIVGVAGEVADIGAGPSTLSKKPRLL